MYQKNLLMKRNIIYSVLLFVLVTWISCSQETMERDLECEDKFEEVYVPRPVSSLTSFAGYDLIVLSSGNEIFGWSPSVLREGSAMVVKYEVLYGRENENFQKDDKDLLAVRIANNLGVDTLLTVSHTVLNNIAVSAGIGTDEIGTVSWKVRAYCGLDTSLSSVTGYFRMLRPAAEIATANFQAAIPYYIDINNEVHYITEKSNTN